MSEKSSSPIKYQIPPTRFNLYDTVIIDGDRSLKTKVTAITFRSYNEPLYEVSWVSDSNARTAWIEEPRLGEPE